MATKLYFESIGTPTPEASSTQTIKNISDADSTRQDSLIGKRISGYNPLANLQLTTFSEDIRRHNLGRGA